MSRGARVLSLLGVLLLALFALVPTASAFDGRTGDQVTISKDEVIDDDLVLGATTVVVDGTVNGDLFAGGQTVILNGKVAGSLYVAGSSVTVNGTIGHDLVAVGAAVRLGPDARIGYNAYALGAGVETERGSQIDGSLAIGGGQGLIVGQVSRDLAAATSRLRLEGTVGRNAKLSVDTSAREYSPTYYAPGAPALPAVPAGLTFGSEASIGGALEYVSSESVDVPASVTARVTHTLPPQDAQLSRELAQRQSVSSYLFDALRRLVGLLIVGVLLAWLAPRWITHPARKLLSKPLPSLGAGLVSIVAAPFGWLAALGVVIAVAVVFGLLALGNLTALTLLAGMPVLVVALVVLVLVAAYLTSAIVAYLVGYLILSFVREEWNDRIYGPLLIGLVALGVLFAVPVVGGWLQFLVVVVGLGAIVLTLLQRPSAERPLGDAPAANEA